MGAPLNDCLRALARLSAGERGRVLAELVRTYGLPAGTTVLLEGGARLVIGPRVTAFAVPTDAVPIDVVRLERERCAALARQWQRNDPAHPIGPGDHAVRGEHTAAKAIEAAILGGEHG